MPYLFVVEVKYENGKYVCSPSDLLSNFPYLEGKVVTGKFISMYRDGKIIRIDREFKFKVSQSGTTTIGEILEPNPLKAIGSPLPSHFLVAACKYEEKVEEGKVTSFPIAENIMLRGGYTSYFEDEIKRILKEEEAGLILEGTTFHSQLEEYASSLKEALLSFEQKNYPYTKTSCRKIVEEIRLVISKWKTIDGSVSLCEKMKSVVNTLYSFASIGGPHGGVVTREETEFILKTTTSLLFYVNSLMKNQRVVEED
ncbi:MAG: hypothetical protein ACP5KW_12150 [Thermoproteota archaeon]